MSHPGRCRCNCAKNGVLRRVKFEAEAALLVGNRLPLDCDVWRCVLEFVLPIEDVGYDSGHRLRVTLRGDDRKYSRLWVPEILLPRAPWCLDSEADEPEEASPRSFFRR